MASCEAKFQQNDGNDAVNENNDDDDDDDDDDDNDDDDDCSNSVSANLSKRGEIFKKSNFYLATCEAKFPQNDGDRDDDDDDNDDDDNDDNDDNDDDDDDDNDNYDNFDANDGDCDDCSNSVDCMQRKSKYQQMCLKQGNSGEKSEFSFCRTGVKI